MTKSRPDRGSVPPPPQQAPPSASPLFLREDEVRRGLDLLLFGYGRLARAADARLQAEGLGRAHHRALYYIARDPDLPVSRLIDLLGVTKQSLARVLAQLEERALVTVKQGRRDRRQRLIRLTDTGAALEAELFTALGDRLSAAYGAAGQNAVTGFWQVLEGLVSPSDRRLLGDLGGE